MSVRFRPFDLRRTFVIQIYSAGGERASRYVLLAVHRREHDWGVVFCNALRLMMETPDLRQGLMLFAEGGGQLTWRRTAFWTIIRVELNAFSKNKRALIAASLLKAARYRN